MRVNIYLSCVSFLSYVLYLSRTYSISLVRIIVLSSRMSSSSLVRVIYLPCAPPISLERFVYHIQYIYHIHYCYVHDNLLGTLGIDYSTSFDVALIPALSSYYYYPHHRAIKLHPS
jgi:hypothetical protein